MTFGQWQTRDYRLLAIRVGPRTKTYHAEPFGRRRESEKEIYRNKILLYTKLAVDLDCSSFDSEKER